MSRYFFSVSQRLSRFWNCSCTKLGWNPIRTFEMCLQKQHP